jgi:histidyl-tRNA synthetase
VPASNAAWFDLLESRVRQHEAGARGLAALREIVQLSTSTGAGAHVRVDPSLARGLSYYTGAIFEVAVADLAGSLGGGGRYDNLVGMFSGESVPACGFSLGLERILVVMGERGMFPSSVTAPGADVLTTVWNAATVDDTLVLARQLRAAGLRVEVYPEADKLGKQMKHASARGVRFATIVGDDERAQGTVMVKELTTGQQAPVSRAEVAGWIAARINGT